MNSQFYNTFNDGFWLTIGGAVIGLFGMFKKKKSGNNANFQIIIKQLNMIKQQLSEIQIQLRDNFKYVFEYLDNITHKLYSQYVLSLNTYHKITQLALAKKLDITM